jgi:hypothetical protein
MIDAATMNRLARIKLVQRDRHRIAVIAAEERTSEARRLADRRCEEAVAAVAALTAIATFDSAADLELRARAATESASAAATARQALAASERALEADRHQRIESERDVRGLELAKARMAQQQAAREEKAEARLLETREAHRTGAAPASRAADRASRRPPAPPPSVAGGARAPRTR